MDLAGWLWFACSYFKLSQCLAWEEEGERKKDPDWRGAGTSLASAGAKKAVGKCHSFPPSSGLAPGKMIKQEHLASASQFSFPNHTVLREVMEFYAQKGPGVNFHPAWKSPSPWGGHLATTWIPSVAEVLYFQEVTYSSKWDIIIKEREKENRTLGLELFTLSADPLLNLGTSTFSPT